MVIKLGLLGPHNYLRDRYNVFDFAITWVGLIEITVQVGNFDFAANFGVLSGRPFTEYRVAPYGANNAYHGGT